MTGKGKVENFDDLDTIDEDQWGEETDSAVASEGALPRLKTLCAVLKRGLLVDCYLAWF